MCNMKLVPSLKTTTMASLGQVCGFGVLAFDNLAISQENVSLSNLVFSRS